MVHRSFLFAFVAIFSSCFIVAEDGGSATVDKPVTVIVKAGDVISSSPLLPEQEMGFVGNRFRSLSEGSLEPRDAQQACPTPTRRSPFAFSTPSPCRKDVDGVPCSCPTPPTPRKRDGSGVRSFCPTPEIGKTACLQLVDKETGEVYAMLMVPFNMEDEE